MCILKKGPSFKRAFLARTSHTDTHGIVCFQEHKTFGHQSLFNRMVFGKTPTKMQFEIRECSNYTSEVANQVK